jgi:hypothetical protein
MTYLMSHVTSLNNTYGWSYKLSRSELLLYTWMFYKYNQGREDYNYQVSTLKMKAILIVCCLLLASTFFIPSSNAAGELASGETKSSR